MTLLLSPEELRNIERSPPSDGVVWLGWFTPDDAPTLCDGDRDPEHRRRFELPDDHEPSVLHAQAVIRAWEVDRQEQRRLAFAVRRLSGELVGGCEVRPNDSEALSLSYWTYPAHRGRGYCQRGVRLVCGWLRALDRFAQVEVLAAPDNEVSRRVARASGFEEVGARDGHVVHVASLRDALEAGR